ncbi:hypothetical protein [Streptomyces sp. N35]|uniref:hypothetical protein n=1 Tax=Streptomyces sp. N35 TaxID=2795730 RepID=UPI0018F348FF|nr:hypothetical protein [Streptomyces sp. N35]
MNAPEVPLHSYASPTRRRNYVTAMHQLAATRTTDTPARVYFSAPPSFRERPNWDRRLTEIRDALPHGVELLHYETALAAALSYDTAWQELAPTLDGLIVTGTRAKPGKTRIIQLGPTGRAELITMVAAGKPVLLHTIEHGLIPVVDCRPKRHGVEPHTRLRLTIPKDWQPLEPTLQAALDALQQPSAPRARAEVEIMAGRP